MADYRDHHVRRHGNVAQEQFDEDVSLVMKELDLDIKMARIVVLLQDGDPRSLITKVQTGKNPFYPSRRF